MPQAQAQSADHAQSFPEGVSSEGTLKGEREVGMTRREKQMVGGGVLAAHPQTHFLERIPKIIETCQSA